MRRKSLDASLALHLSSPSSTSPLHDHRHARQPSSSAPSSPTRAHPSPSLSPSPAIAVPALPRPRPKSTLPPPARKPAPQITPSVIRAAGGVERVRETGGVPSRLVALGEGGAAQGSSGVGERERDRQEEQGGTAQGREGAKEQGREEQEQGGPPPLDGWFTASEIRAVGAATAFSSSPPSGSAGGGAAQQQHGGEQEAQDDERAPYETDTARAFRGAMAEVEAALRAEEDAGTVQDEGERGPVGRAR